MRRSVSLLTPLLPLILAGCEDGPNQTFQPAKGDLFNNGQTPAAVDDAGTSYGQTFGGTSKTEVCSGAELQDQWDRMVHQPIHPPYNMAGVDISGPAGTFTGLTVDQAIHGPLMPVMGAPNPPTRLCQGSNLGGGGNGGEVGGSLVTGWGNNGEFYMEWAIPTHKDIFNYLNPGYVGTMEWDFQTNDLNTPCPAGMTNCAQLKCSDMMYPAGDNKKHHYTIQLGQPFKKDGKVYQLDWTGFATPPGTHRFYCEEDELYRGITSNFAADLYDNLPAGVNCNQSGRCLTYPPGNDGVHPIMGFRTVSMYFDMGPPNQPQPSGSTLRDIYYFNIKYTPYSQAISLLKMDPVGPTASLGGGNATYTGMPMPWTVPIGQNGTDCELSLGLKFSDLNKNCVSVYKDQAVNDIATAKTLGNILHDDQNFIFSVVGVNQNYRDPAMDLGGAKQFQIIQDSDVSDPKTFVANEGNAIALDYTFDVRASGSILNDKWARSTFAVYSRDNHGAGSVFREYGRLVQKDLAAKYAAIHGTVPKTLHDPTCLYPIDPNTGTYPAGFDPATWRAAPGCTGFEGMVDDAYPNVLATTGLPVDPNDPSATDPNNVWDIGGAAFNGAGFKPGTPTGAFCMDPGLYNFCGFDSNSATGSPYGNGGNGILDDSYNQVIQIMGSGDPNNLPPGTGDYRYFWKFFATAYAKYLASGAACYQGQHVKAFNDNIVCGNLCKADADCGGVAGSCNTAKGQCKAKTGAVPYYGDFVLDTDNLFFDSFGGNANSGEFVDFTNADLTHDPMGLKLETLLIGTNLQTVHFYRRLDREERAIFLAMQNANSKAGDPTRNIPANQAAWGLTKDANGKPILNEANHPRKSADVFLSNIAGSPAIGAVGFGQPLDAMGNPVLVGTATAYDPCNPTLPAAQVAKTPWYCATHVDADCVSGGPGGSPGLQAPTDNAGNMILRENGEPLLAGYCGIWNPTALALGTNNVKLINNDITPQQQQFWTEAEVEIPIFANPYDQTSAKGKPVHALVPWLPMQEGVGFQVPNSGDTSVFVRTAELDFAGQVITPVMDYIPVDDGKGNISAQIIAYESQDYLGDAFLCYDTVSAATYGGTNPGRPGDILAAHMYTSVGEIVHWISTHPGAQDNCSLIVRYSPYNNYPDFVTSLANGIVLGIDQGAGFGRVTDITMFTPGAGAPAPP